MKLHPRQTSSPDDQLVLHFERAKRRCEDNIIACNWLFDFTARRKLADLPHDSCLAADVIALDLEAERLALCVRLLKERARL
jgi:hypothetical protein